VGKSVLTKTEMLKFLSQNLKNSIIEPFVSFTLDEWLEHENETIVKIESVFSKSQLLIIRSSSYCEDSFDNSLAGHFHSELNINSNDYAKLSKAVNNVIDSYSKDDRKPSPRDKILVQSQLQDISLCGVVLTRDIRDGLPYYLINYDDITGKTNTVTSGHITSAMRSVRWQEFHQIPLKWQRLIQCVQEIENLFPIEILDIEFAIDSNDDIHIFQVRTILSNNLITNRKTEIETEKRIKESIAHISTQYKTLCKGSQHLPGHCTIFTDMTDWNPAEIIGNRPNVFDYSLYRFLVTQSTWNKSRVSLGYTDVSPAELMVLIGDKPYIDTRVSFNSLTPSTLSLVLKNKLINYYLAKLSSLPNLQDKVEFEIVFSCFDLTFYERENDLRTNGFSDLEIDQMKNHLLSFTNKLLTNAKDIITFDLRNTRNLKDYLSSNCSLSCSNSAQEFLEEAFELLEYCKNIGVFSFARLARLAFLYLSILKSLVKFDVLEQHLFNVFMNSIETIATTFAKDIDLFRKGEVSNEFLLRKYGHLRPGTYNVLALRYDHNPKIFEQITTSNLHRENKITFEFDHKTIREIDSTLEKCGIHYDAHHLLEFTQKTLRYREYSKFVYTKALSNAIELLVLAFEKLGFSRDDLSMVDLYNLKKLVQAKHFHIQKVKEILKDEIKKNRNEKRRYGEIALPPVIRNSRDFLNVPYYASTPNFITDKQIQGEILILEPLNYDDFIPEITGKIILIENADPGFDWIFSRGPKGLVTKYGGAASHMAIRCAEFTLPAVIGCGEICFEKLVNSVAVKIDCKIQSIIPLYS